MFGRDYFVAVRAALDSGIEVIILQLPYFSVKNAHLSGTCQCQTHV